MKSHSAQALSPPPRNPFLAVHQPFVNSNKAHAIAVEGEPVQQAVEALLYAARVDVVISGHVHAYERSCKVFNFSCVADGPLYLTVGDGGTPEGLATTWVEPCPAWSAYRQGSWGHGELEALNATHLSWRWRQNDDLTPALVDELVLVKGQQVRDAGNCATVAPALSTSGRRRLAGRRRRDEAGEAGEAGTRPAQTHS